MYVYVCVHYYYYYYYYYIIIIIIIIMLLLLLLLLMSSSSFVTDLSLLVLLLLNQQLSSPLRLQVSDCSTFHTMCEERGIAVFVVTLRNDFLVWLPNFSLNLFLLLWWLQLLLVYYISGSTFVVSLYTNSCILASFPLPFA